MIDILIQQGLTEKEAELYMMLVRYGASRGATISKTVRMNRTLAYALLDNLVQKGFVEKLARNNKTYYVANNPQIFIQRATSQMEQAQLLVESLQNIQLIASQPVVRTFQGLDGIKQMTDIFLQEAKTTGREMLQLGQEIQFVLAHPNLIEDFIGKRTGLKIPLRLLCNRFAGFKIYLNPERDQKELRQVKFVKKEDLDVDCTTYIYGDSMAVLSLSGEMQGYIFKSANVTDLYRKVFNLLWDRL